MTAEDLVARGRDDVRAGQRFPGERRVCERAPKPAGVTAAISARGRSSSGMRANQNVAPSGSVVKPKAALLPRTIR